MFSTARRLALAVGLLAWMGSNGMAQTAGQDDAWDKINKLNWQFEGADGKIGQEATFKIPQGHAFLDSADTRRFLELNGNPPRDNRYVIGPTSLKWFGVFFFESIGYVRDDEKIDPDALLTSLKETNRASQEERRKLGMQSLILEGWHVPPRYDAETKR